MKHLVLQYDSSQVWSIYRLDPMNSGALLQKLNTIVCGCRFSRSTEKRSMVGGKDAPRVGVLQLFLPFFFP